MAFDVLDVVPHLFWGQLDFYGYVYWLFRHCGSLTQCLMGYYYPNRNSERPGNRPGPVDPNQLRN